MKCTDRNGKKLKTSEKSWIKKLKIDINNIYRVNRLMVLIILKSFKNTIMSLLREPEKIKDSWSYKNKNDMN